MKSPGKDSQYARKLRGIYPTNSPYLTNDWGPRMRVLQPSFVPAQVARGQQHGAF